MFEKLRVNLKTKMIVDLNVKPEDEDIVITTVPWRGWGGADPDYINMLASLIQAKSGKLPTVVVTPRKRLYCGGALGIPKSAMAALKSADLLFITGFSMAYVDEGIEIWESGTRTVKMGHDRDIGGLSEQTKEDIFQIRETNFKYEKLLSEAKNFHLTSKSGTDLTGSIKDRLYFPVHSIAEGITNHGNAFYAEVMGAPIEGTTEGVFVPDCIGRIGGVGKRNFREPVKLIMKDGLLEDVEGGREAKLFKRMIFECGDPNARNVAEMAVGTWKREKPEYTDDIELMKLQAGWIHIAFGDNHGYMGHPRVRGKVTSILHIDAAASDVSLDLDGKTVVDKGKLLY